MLLGAHQFCSRQHPCYVIIAGPDDSSCLRCFARIWKTDSSNSMGLKPLILQLRLWTFPVGDFFEVGGWKSTLTGYLFICVPDKPWCSIVYVQIVDWFTSHLPTMPKPHFTLFLYHINIPGLYP